MHKNCINVHHEVFLWQVYALCSCSLKQSCFSHGPNHVLDSVGQTFWRTCCGLALGRMQQLLFLEVSQLWKLTIIKILMQHPNLAPTRTTPLRDCSPREAIDLALKRESEEVHKEPTKKNTRCALPDFDMRREAAIKRPVSIPESFPCRNKLGCKEACKYNCEQCY